MLTLSWMACKGMDEDQEPDYMNEFPGILVGRGLRPWRVPAWSPQRDEECTSEPDN